MKDWIVFELSRCAVSCVKSALICFGAVLGIVAGLRVGLPSLDSSHPAKFPPVIQSGK